jgi:hypothetical protein
VRTTVSLVVAAVCLGLAGCGTLGKKKADSASAAGGPGGDRAAPRTGTPEQAPAVPLNGYVAGQVIDNANHRPAGVQIEVVDLQDVRKGAAAAAIDVETDKQGYFKILGLQPGRYYQLIARKRDGTRVSAGTVLVQPPNPRVSIFLTDDLPAADPGAKPAAAIEPPTKPKPETNPAPATPPKTGEGTSGAGAAPPASVLPPVIAHPPNYPNIVDGPATDGFQRTPRVTIPGPPPSNPILPPPPGSRPAEPPRSAPPPATPPPGGSLSQTGAVPTEDVAPIPFCGREGSVVRNFGLNDYQGNRWELKRNRTGRLVLLDIGCSTCSPCCGAIPHLRRLQAEYGRSGLEVVSICYEQGALEEQYVAVAQMRWRYDINYVTLLGGPPGPKGCPVQVQLEAYSYPTFFLLDEAGRILGTWKGLTKENLADMESRIRKGLNAP